MTVRHDGCETMGGSVYADFVIGIIDPFAVRGQRKMVPATKTAEVWTKFLYGYLCTTSVEGRGWEPVWGVGCCT